MIRIPVSADSPDAAAIVRAVSLLKADGIVAYPTDTLYGLAVDPRNERAVDRLFAIKGRSRDVAVPLIAADVHQARSAGTFSPRDLKLAEVFWPGPLTLVVPAAPNIPPALLGGRTTVALRVPAHPVARALASALDFCITATSANLSGREATADPDDVARALGGLLDGLLDAGPTPGGAPSTIVETGAADGPRLVRDGAIPWSRVLESLE